MSWTLQVSRMWIVGGGGDRRSFSASWRPASPGNPEGKGARLAIESHVGASIES